LSRKQSREVVFKLIFPLSDTSLCGTDKLLETLELACEDGTDTCPGQNLPTGPELEYIKRLCAAVTDNFARIDELIKTYSKGFAFERIFKTDLAALRLGIAEIKFFGLTPPVVAVNEAVEIAKKYGTEKSGGFVNGILAQVLANSEALSANFDTPTDSGA
jgi:N utilization substance protein B